MDKESILRKRNIELVKENAELKEKVLDQETEFQKAKNSIKENEEIKQSFMDSINELHKLKKQYETLICEIKKYEKSIKRQNLFSYWIAKLKK